MNNINLNVLKKFIVAVQKDSSQAKKNKRITGQWIFTEGKPQFSAKIEFAKGNVKVNSELPSFAGGWGTSPDPIQYCLYGLAACFAVTFAGVATSEGIRLKRLEVTAENWMDLRKQLGLGKENIIKKVKFSVLAEGASRKKLEKLLKLAEQRCPGTECITRKIPLEVELLA